ncbi:hypothetical protein ABPG72_011580 [Tetrahymena utriculariae]
MYSNFNIKYIVKPSNLLNLRKLLNQTRSRDIGFIVLFLEQNISQIKQIAGFYYIFRISNHNCQQQQQVLELKLCKKLNQEIGQYQYQQEFAWYEQSFVNNVDDCNEDKKKLVHLQKCPSLIYAPSQIEDLLKELKFVFNNFISFEKQPILKKQNSIISSSYFEKPQWQQQQEQYQEVIQAQDMIKYIRQRKYNIARKGFGFSYTINDIEDDGADENDASYLKIYLRKSDLTECKLIRQVLLNGQFVRSIQQLKRQNRQHNFKTLTTRKFVKFTLSVIQYHQSLISNMVAFFKYYGQLFTLNPNALYYDLYEQQDFNLENNQKTVMLSFQII